jgi:hypothetical protein
MINEQFEYELQIDQVYSDFSYNMEVYRNTLVYESLIEVLTKIENRMNEIVRTRIPGYECSLDAIADNKREYSFKHTDLSNSPLEVITSRKVYAKCLELINKLNISDLNERPKPLSDESLMEFSEFDLLDESLTYELWYAQTYGVDISTNHIDKSRLPLVTKSSELKDLTIIPRFNNSEFVLNKLELILQSLTFKELGVIGTSDVPYRPSTTRLFNFLKCVNITGQEVDPLNGDNIYFGSASFFSKESLKERTSGSFLAKRFLPRINQNILPTVKSTDK